MEKRNLNHQLNLRLAQALKEPSTGSPLFAKNSPPGCFLNAKTLAGSNPYSPNIIKIPEQ